MHRHFCEVRGHYWECDGNAARPLTGNAEPTVCICMDHGVSMEEGDHSQCSVELLACPDHCDEQLRAMGYEPGTSNMPHISDEEAGPQWHDKDGKPIIGFCLWCNRDFYTYEDMQAHNANDMADCIGFQQYKTKKRRRATGKRKRATEDISEFVTRRSDSSTSKPATGIFWFCGSRVFLACTSLSDSEHYGDCLTSPLSHDVCWDELRENGTVGADEEYDEFPRGRVVYDVQRDLFVLYADPCILKRKKWLDILIEQFGLPLHKLETKKDAHYRCPACLPKTSR